MLDIIERLGHDEMFVDAIDDAIAEIQRLRSRVENLETAQEQLETAMDDFSKEIKMPAKYLQRDLEYFLPLRWAFHCYFTPPPAKRWEFEEWREYLLSWKDWSAEDEVRVFQTNAKFQSDVLQFLAANDVRSLINFYEFNQRLEEEYLSQPVSDGYCKGDVNT